MLTLLFIQVLDRLHENGGLAPLMASHLCVYMVGEDTFTFNLKSVRELGTVTDMLGTHLHALPV